MTNDPLDVIAVVECRSEGGRDDIPVAVVIGGVRFRIANVVDRAVLATAVAGEAVRNRFWVELEDGRRCELTCVVPDGTWRVKVE